MKFVAALLFVVLFGGCNDTNKNLISAPIVLAREPVTVSPKRPLKASKQFNLLCVAIPKAFRMDGLTLRDPHNKTVVLTATLAATDGADYKFSQHGFLNDTYLCLQSEGVTSKTLRYKSIKLHSDTAMSTDDIRWISTDSL